MRRTLLIQLRRRGREWKSKRVERKPTSKIFLMTGRLILRQEVRGQVLRGFRPSELCNSLRTWFSWMWGVWGTVWWGGDLHLEWCPLPLSTFICGHTSTEAGSSTFLWFFFFKWEHLWSTNLFQAVKAPKFLTGSKMCLQASFSWCICKEISARKAQKRNSCSVISTRNTFPRTKKGFITLHFTFRWKLSLNHFHLF